MPDIIRNNTRDDAEAPLYSTINKLRAQTPRARDMTRDTARDDTYEAPGELPPRTYAHSAADGMYPDDLALEGQQYTRGNQYGGSNMASMLGDRNRSMTKQSVGFKDNNMEQVKPILQVSVLLTVPIILMC